MSQPRSPSMDSSPLPHLLSESARSDCLGAIQAYSRLLEQHLPDFYPRLVAWLNLSLCRSGLAADTVRSLINSRKDIKAQCWLLRQFLYDADLQKLEQKLRQQVELLGDRPDHMIYFD